MSPGPKKRAHQNKYRKDKTIDSKREEVHDSIEENKDRDRNLTPDRHCEALGDESKEVGVNKETPYFKKYNKRKVVSNWNRYEETPNAENEELRGVDYEVALTCSSGVVSQFRFEAEKEWEDESLQIDTSEFTSIDCNALAAALDCIPFHKRLGISEDVFTPEMVEEFYVSANIQRNLYVPPKTATGTYLLSHNESICKSKPQKEFSPAIIESLTSCLNIKDESTAENEEIGHLDKVAQKKEIDTELDFLLSLSECNEKDNAPKKINPILQDSVSAQSILQSNPPESPLVPNSTEISIDDWLDKIVED